MIWHDLVSFGAGVGGAALTFILHRVYVDQVQTEILKKQNEILVHQTTILRSIENNTRKNIKG